MGGVPVSKMEETIEAHYQASLKTAKDPVGGSYPAYPSGKSWDEASGKTGSGKKFYHNVISGADFATQPYYVAIITPVIHYCMGGLEIDENSAVLGSGSQAIPGLYAAGEVAGGVHGNNRLGGNSLLDCVVFGRVAGVACAKYMLGDKVKATSLAELSGGGLSGNVEASKLAGGSYEDTMNSSSEAAVKKQKKASSGFTMDEVAKHTKKGDVWVVLHGRVLNVSNFLSQHPGGELAILTFAGKDATAEFDMIHPPDVVEKYAPDAIIGVVGNGKAKKAKGAAKSALPVATDKGDPVANLEVWGDWRMEAFDDTPGVLLVNVRSYVNACYYLILSIIYEICATIFSAKNFKISNDRTGLTRGAVFLIFFIVVHAVGNLHVFKGPDDFNGYGYFFVRLNWTWDQKLSSGLMSGQLNLAITGLMLLTFMTIHLFQFRFADTEQYLLRPPPTLINWHPSWLITLTFFWTDNKQVPLVPVRDIFLNEYKVLKNPVWCGFYIMAVLIFMTHACLGWGKLTLAPSFGIPKKHQCCVKFYGYLIFWVIGLIYISFPVFVTLTQPKNGHFGQFNKNYPDF